WPLGAISNLLAPDGQLTLAPASPPVTPLTTLRTPAVPVRLTAALANVAPTQFACNPSRRLPTRLLRSPAAGPPLRQFRTRARAGGSASAPRRAGPWQKG